MRDKVVIYKTKYGSTKKYAQWIAEEIGSDIFPYSKIKSEDLQKYSVIVYGGNLHAAGISGLKLIKNNLQTLKGKKIVVFSVGAASINKKTINDVKNANFTPEELEWIKVFCLRGAFNYQKLNFIDKILMLLLKLKLKSIKEEDRDEETKGMLAAYDNPADFTDKDNIKPILDTALKK